ARGAVNRAGQSEAEVGIDLGIVTDLAKEGRRALLRLSNLPVDFATGNTGHRKESICAHVHLTSDLGGESVHYEVADERVVHCKPIVSSAIVLVTVIHLEVPDLQRQVFHEGIENVH